MQEEIVQTIESLSSQLEDLVVRGVRSTGAEHLSVLETIRVEFERIGAAHLAGRIQGLVDAIRADDAGAAKALLRAQTSLRLFERLLTLEFAGETLQTLIAFESRDCDAFDHEAGDPIDDASDEDAE